MTIAIESKFEMTWYLQKLHNLKKICKRAFSGDNFYSDLDEFGVVWGMFTPSHKEKENIFNGQKKKTCSHAELRFPTKLHLAAH